MLSIRRVLLRGPIEDAFVYRSTILCWTFGGAMLRVPVPAVERALERDFGEAGVAVSALLFHSGGLGASADQSEAWWRNIAYDAEDSDFGLIEIDLSTVEHSEHRLGIEADDVLDMLAYADRLYLATDGGLFSNDLTSDFNSNVEPASHRISVPTYAAAASYGSVAASCGEAGLRMLFDDFGWSGRTADHRAERVSDYSVRAEYASGRLLNFRSHSEIELFRGDVVEASAPRSPNEARVIVGLEAVDEAGDDLLDRFDSADVDFVTSWLGKLLVLAGGRVMSRTLRRRDDRLTAQGQVKTIGHYRGKPLSAVRVRDRLLVETSEELLALSSDDDEAGNGYQRVGTGPVVSLRAFPNSKRYRDMAIVTSEAGLNLIGVPRVVRAEC